VTFKVVYCAVLGAALALGATAQAAPDDAEDAKIRAAISALASPDPEKRDEATRTLVGLGAEARRAVFEAARSEDPEIAAKAGQILLKLPWYLPDDSPEVRRLLERYGAADVDGRRQVVAGLSQLTQHGYDALARLIEEEPNADVKWTIVSAVRRTYRETSLEGFRKVDLSTDSAPLLAAGGHAWLLKDVEKGAKLLEKALTLDAQQPANDQGEVEFAYQRLENLALLAGQYDRAAEVLRARARRNAADEDGDASTAVLELFAAHAKFGPLKGFAEDVKTYSGSLNDSRVLFALGKAYERAGRPLLAAATCRAAFMADLVSVQDRFDQGDFLLRNGWLDLADAQFAAVFDLAQDHSGDAGRRRNENMPPELDEANAHFRLSQVAAAREDDVTAATHMRQAMELHYKGRGDLNGTTDQQIWQEINWHAMRSARAKGDQASVAARLEEFVKTPPENPDIANDVVPMLRDAGRGAEAKALLDTVYQNLQKTALIDPDHPMPKNNIAWLLARCGERKEEALRLALEATRLQPDNFAYVDTLAEAHFQLGHYDEAVRLETRAVGVRPNDPFLRNQLRRFEEAAAAAKKKAE
jgi:tetratricopeptide (TPR) repeat protein